MADPLAPKEFLAGYVAETDEYLTASIQRLLSLEALSRDGKSDPRTVRDVLRALHTIKGLSAMVDVQPIVELAHTMEALVRSADQAGADLRSDAIEALLQGARAIEERLAALSGGHSVPPAPADVLDALLRADVATMPAPVTTLVGFEDHPEVGARLGASERAQLLRGSSAGRRVVRVDFVPSRERSEAGISIQSVREKIERLAEIVKVVPIGVPRTDEVPAGIMFAMILLTDADDAALCQAACAEPRQVRPIEISIAPSPIVRDLRSEPPAAPTATTVRVDVERLDAALDKLSALVVTRFKLQRAVVDLRARGVDVRQLQGVVDETARHLRALRSTFMTVRMVPVAEMLQRVPLMVRQMAAVSGKAVQLKIETGRAELDKGVSERVFPAIVHLLRNAIDHGIEQPDARARLGKPGEGTVRVTCTERGSSQLELTVHDDGAGVDRERVAEAAGVAVPADDQALLELIVNAGLTTSRGVTHTSGRGMGMNIVKQITAEQLGGQLSLRTRPGLGSSFTLLIPLTLTIIDAFSFECASQSFVVPVAAIERIVEIEPSRVLSPPDLGKGSGAAVRLLSYGTEVVPLIALDALLGLQRGKSQGRKALVVRRHNAPYAFEVDRLLGQHEAVVRPLEDALIRVPGISGAADLGDGAPTLVLDLAALAKTFESMAESAP